MPRHLFLRVLALLLAFALVAAACGGDDDDDGTGTETPADDGGAADTDPEPEDPEPGDDSTDDAADEGGADDDGASEDAAACDATVPGTQIDYGTFAPNRAFDPTRSSGALVGGTEIAAVYDVLFIFDPETGEIVPHVAESLEPNEDFTQWTLKLRDGITYSDGTPLTAQLVSDNIDRYFEEGVTNTSGGFLQFITDRTVVDDLTLEMTLSTPIAEMGLIFADEPGMVVNTNAIGDDLDAFGVQPPDAAGLGPYIVERNIPGEETVLTARQDYWGGPVCIETLRFVWIPGSQPTYEAWQNGDLNVAFLRDPVVIAASREAGDEGFFFNQDGGLMYSFNHRPERGTSDPRVREAVSLAIDETILNDRGYQGALQARKSYIGEGSRFFSDAVEAIPTDAERAATLVEEAKADGWDGTIQLEVQSSPPSPDIALAVEGMLEAVGIEVEPSVLPVGENIAKLGEGDFDLIQTGFNSGPGTGVLSLVRNLSSTSPTNRNAYASEEMDALLNEALATPGGELTDVMAEINNLINADFVALPIGSLDEGIIWADGISGIVPTVSTIYLFHDAVIAQ